VSENIVLGQSANQRTLEMTDSQKKIYDTPILDSLIPKKRRLVKIYCQCLDKTLAAEEAGYVDTNNQLHETVNKMFSDPRIISAIEEYLSTKLEQLDQGRAAICQRLLNQSLAGLDDVAKRVPYVNGNGQTIAGKWSIVPKEPKDIESRFQCAMSFIMRNHDGSYGWDNMAQHRATQMLSKLMMWDQSILDQNPPLIFNFGAVQEDDYLPPSESTDLSVVDPEVDEVDDLVH